MAKTPALSSQTSQAEAEKTPRARPETKKRPPTKTTRKGNGAGWGGEAKGAGTGKRPALQGDPGPGRTHFSILGEEKKQRDERRTETLLKKLWDLSFEAEAENVQLQAAVHALNRIDGMPVQRVVASTTDDLTDEERAAQLAAFRSATVGLALPRGPHGVGDTGPGPDEPNAGTSPSGTS